MKNYLQTFNYPYDKHCSALKLSRIINKSSNSHLYANSPSECKLFSRLLALKKIERLSISTRISYRIESNINIKECGSNKWFLGWISRSSRISVGIKNRTIWLVLLHYCKVFQGLGFAPVWWLVKYRRKLSRMADWKFTSVLVVLRTRFG